MDIDRTAPVTASSEAVIYAPLTVVWNVITTLDEWSSWNPDVKDVQVDGALQAETTFRWRAGGIRIVSTLCEVIPERRLAWTGRTAGVRAVHVWRFTERDDGVLVRTEESFDGLLVRLFSGPMRRMLARSLEKGLIALKLESERRAHPSTM